MTTGIEVLIPGGIQPVLSEIQPGHTYAIGLPDAVSVDQVLEQLRAIADQI